MPLLCDLHWLRVPQRVEYKLSVLVYRCLDNLTLEYLCDELWRVADISSRQRLRLSSTSALMNCCHLYEILYISWVIDNIHMCCLVVAFISTTLVYRRCLVWLYCLLISLDVFCVKCLISITVCWFPCFWSYRWLSCPPSVIGCFVLLLHASGTVCHFTSLRHNLYRLSGEEAEAVFCSATVSRPSFLFYVMLWLFSGG